MIDSGCNDKVFEQPPIKLRLRVPPAQVIIFSLMIFSERSIDLIIFFLLGRGGHR
jgi:hypothetical protein